MATSSEYANMEKRCLGNAPMYVTHVRSSNEERYNAFYLELNEFSKLKDTHFEQTQPHRFFAQRKMCSLYSLVKTNDTLFLKFYSTEWEKKILCYVVYEENKKFSDPLHVRQAALGICFASIPLTAVNVPENKYFKKDILRLQFRFDRQKRTLGVQPATYKTDVSSAVELADDMTKGHLKNVVKPDFLILVEGIEYSIHKIILAARSIFFYNYFKEYHQDEKQVIVLDTTTVEAMNVVNNYLYKGCIFEPPLELMPYIYELALKLDIPSLISRCEAILDVHAGQLKLL